MTEHAGDTPPLPDDADSERRLIARRWFMENDPERSRSTPGEETCWNLWGPGVACLGPRGHQDECGPNAGGMVACESAQEIQDEEAGADLGPLFAMPRD